MAQKTAIILFLLFSMHANAETTSYGPLHFTLPSGWSCTEESQNLVCLDQTNKEQKSSAIVISYKNRSPEDTLAIYHDQLSRPKTLQNDEVTTLSEVKSVNEVALNGLTWVDGVHLGSEIAGYITHYLATVAGPYAILFSLSIYQSTYTQTFALLKPMIDSLAVDKNLIEQTAATNSQQNQISGAVGSTQNLEPKARKRIQIGPYNLPQSYVILGGAFLAAICLLLYAVFKA